MIAITKDSFFATVGQIDVHPHIVGGYDRVHGYTQDWKLRYSDAIIGRTVDAPKQYLVTPEFFEKNRAKMVVAAQITPQRAAPHPPGRATGHAPVPIC